MNNFSSTESGNGILKDAYDDDTPLESALKRKRKKLEATSEEKVNDDEPESN